MGDENECYHWEYCLRGLAVSCYYPQTGRSVIKKEEFSEPMNRAIISKKVLLEVGFNNDHVGSDMGCLGEFMGFLGLYK